MMYQIFLDWLGDFSGVSSDIIFIFVCVASLAVLNFIFDFFRFILYYCSGR